MATYCILGLSGSVNRPSRTTVLVERILRLLAEQTDTSTRLVELAHAAPLLFQSLTPDRLSRDGREIIEAVENADILVVGTPVYRASYTGALKHLFDLARREPFAGKPVILAATGGSLLHGLVIEHALRPLFGFFNAHPVPTTIYAAEAAFQDYRLVDAAVDDRIARAVAEAVRLLDARSQPSASPFPPQLHRSPG